MDSARFEQVASRSIAHVATDRCPSPTSVWCRSLHVVSQAVVHFDTDLPQYHTSGGVLRGAAHLHIAPTGDAKRPHSAADDLVVVAPALMFVEAVDLIFKRLSALKSFSMNQVRSPPPPSSSVFLPSQLSLLNVSDHLHRC